MADHGTMTALNLFNVRMSLHARKAGGGSGVGEKKSMLKVLCEHILLSVQWKFT